ELPENEQQHAMEAFLQQDQAKGVDLSQAPLMRLALLRIAARKWHLVWTVHHLLIDRWSAAHVCSEMTAAYQALAGGRPLDLPPSRPFRDYIRWLRQQD